jgi:hypothetical protein
MYFRNPRSSGEEPAPFALPARTFRHVLGFYFLKAATRNFYHFGSAHTSRSRLFQSLDLLIEQLLKIMSNINLIMSIGSKIGSVFYLISQSQKLLIFPVASSPRKIRNRKKQNMNKKKNRHAVNVLMAVSSNPLSRRIDMAESDSE